MDAALVQLTSVRDEALDILSRLGAPESAFAREGVMALSPITGELIAQVRITSPEQVSTVIGRATQAFNAWRTVPAPRRGAGHLSSRLPRRFPVGAKYVVEGSGGEEGICA